MRATPHGLHDTARAPRPTPRALLVVLVVLATLVLAAATTLAATAAPATASAPPTEGAFEKCPLDTALITCVSRLGLMHAGGVQVVVLSPRGATLDGLAQYATAAHDLGMSIMWAIGVPDWWRQPPTSTRLGQDFPQFAAACGCRDNQDLFPYVVTWLRSQPATYGYYAADDTVLSAADEPGIAAYMARLEQLDPGHLAMIGWAGGLDQAAYESMADTLGQEIYPVMDRRILPASADPEAWASVETTINQAQTQADLAGRPSAFILQAFSWGDNLSDGESVGICSRNDTPESCWARAPYPTPQEQLALRNAVLGKARPALILWYSFPGTFGAAAPTGGTLYPSGAQAGAQWAGLSAVITAPWTPAARPGTSTAPPPTTRRAAQAAKAARHRKHRKHRRRTKKHHRRPRHRATRGVGR